MLTKEKLMEIVIDLLSNNGTIREASNENYSEEAKYAYAFNDGVMYLYERIKDELGGFIMININVTTKQREYEFHDAKSWIVDGLFLIVEAKNGDKRFIKTDDIEDILVNNVEDEDE